MKLAGIPMLVLLLFSVIATLVLKVSSPLFLYSLFNAMILVILFGSLEPSGDETDGVWPAFQISLEGAESAYHKIKDNGYDDDYSSDDEDEKDGYEYGSDGYDEDDDDSGSDGEIGWEDDEDSDGSLERRIEEFIAKVNKGWREEWQKDHIQYQSNGMR